MGDLLRVNWSHSGGEGREEGRDPHSLTLKKKKKEKCTTCDCINNLFCNALKISMCNFIKTSEDFL